MSPTSGRTRHLNTLSLRTPLCLLIGWSVLDAGISGLLLHRGVMQEANPLMHLSLLHLGLGATITLKLAVTASASTVLVALRRKLPGLLPALLRFGCLGYALLWMLALVLA